MAHDEYKLHEYDIVAPFLMGIMIASFIGFKLCHLVVNIESPNLVPLFSLEYIDKLLSKHKWVMYVCFITGLLNLFFLISIIGFDNLGDYRGAALSAERTGLFGLVSRIAGHATTLGTFYLFIFGYKQGLSGVNIKNFFFYLLMYSMNNIAIAGRGWITMSLIPYLIGYFFAVRSSGKYRFSEIFDRNFRKIFCIMGILVVFFAVFGSMRNDQNSTEEVHMADKLLYYTDGTGVTNIVMSMYPEGSYQLEYGACEFLSYFKPSPMWTKYSDAISHNLGLSVTVPSMMPFLYFDYGFCGGIIMWGLYCFIFECLVVKLLKQKSLLSLLLAFQIIRMFFQGPIGPIFSMAVPALLWLLIMYIFRRKIFAV